MNDNAINQECFELVEKLAEQAYLGRNRFDWEQVSAQAHQLLDHRFGDAQVELCIKTCRG